MEDNRRNTDSQGGSQGSSNRESSSQAGSQGGSQSRSGMSREEAGRKGGEAPHVCRGRECSEDSSREQE